MRSLRPLLLWSSLGLVAWAGYAVSQVVPSPGPPTGIACAFNTVPPTLTSGQAGWVQCDNAGKIITSGGGGGGGAVTIADGADVAEGTTTDGACAGDATSGCTVLARLSRISARLTTILSTGIPVTNANANGQATMANSSPVVIASNQTAADPCMFQAKTNLPISQNGTSSVQLIALSGSTSIYVCSMFLMTNSTATTFAITTGTGSACVTGNAAVIGTTTANIANSMNLITGAGFTLGSGQGTVAKGAASSELCMILGANVFVSGNLTYVQQ